MTSANPRLVAGGVACAGAAVAHLAVIVGGPDWYRAFGAGEKLAQAAERGSWMSPAITLAVAALLAIWSAYAFSGTGLIPRLPLMHVSLVAISAILLTRGLFVFQPSAFGRPDLSPGFMLWSSLIVLAMGVLYAVGTWRAWPVLSKEVLA